MKSIDRLLASTGDVALRRRASFILKNINFKKSGKILDIGCGDGYYLYLLSNFLEKPKLIGVDPDKRALSSAKKNLPKSIKLIQGHIEKLPFKSNFFNSVIVSEVLEHVDNDYTAAREVYRVLKPGGMGFFSVPHANYPFFWDPINWILEAFFKTHIKSGFWAGFWNQHIRLYYDSELKKVLNEGGFKNVNLVKLTHYCLPFNHYIINLVARLLAIRNNSSQFNKIFSKYKTDNKSVVNLFTPVFIFDKLNDNWNGQGSAVSLVAVVLKK